MKDRFLKISLCTISAILVLSTLVGCGELLSRATGAYSYFDPDAIEKAGYSSALSIDSLPDAYSDSIVKIEGCLMYTAKLSLTGTPTGHAHIYNLSKEKEVYSSENASQIVVFDGGFAVDDGETTTLYNNLGIAITTTERIGIENCGVVQSTSGDFVEFDNKYYNIIDGEILLLNELLPNSLMQAVEYKKNYYYITNNEVIVYGKDRRILSAKPIISFDETPKTAILSNGNVLIQTFREANDGEEYHIASTNDKKYVLTTQLLELYANYLRPVECDYVLHSAYAVDNYNNEDIGNILPNDDRVLIYKIEDKHLHTKLSDCIISPADLAIEYEVTDFYPYAESIYMITRDVFAVKIIGGNDYHVLSDTGSLVAQLPSLVYTSKFIVSEGKIFNTSMNEVFDFYHGGYSILRTVGDSIVLQKDENCYLFSDDSPEYIGKTSEISFEFDNIYVRTTAANGKTIYSYYNDNGEQLFVTNGETTKIVWRDKYVSSEQGKGYYVGYTANMMTGKSAYYKLTVTYTHTDDHAPRMIETN